MFGPGQGLFVLIMFGFQTIVNLDLNVRCRGLNNFEILTTHFILTMLRKEKLVLQWLVVDWDNVTFNFYSLYS